MSGVYPARGLAHSSTFRAMGRTWPAFRHDARNTGRHG